MAKIESNLGKLRRERGFSVSHLAALAGVTRQTIHAIETGSFVPNTTVALKLARAFKVSVEDLFALPADEEPKGRSEQVLFLSGADAPVAGQPVQLCRVDKQLIASAPLPWNPFLPSADAAVAEGGMRAGKAKLDIFGAESDFDNRILVAGCDPALSV